MSSVLMRCCVTNMVMPQEKWVDLPVDEFISNFSIFADSIYFGYFPPIEILNEYLMIGEQNEGMGNNAIWYPFCLTKLGYDEIFHSISSNKNIEKLSNNDKGNNSCRRKR